MNKLLRHIEAALKLFYDYEYVSYGGVVGGDTYVLNTPFAPAELPLRVYVRREWNTGEILKIVEVSL